jgi:ATP-dependent protease Clp ATPase subunit
MDDVQLDVHPDAVREIAAQAMKKGTGARALRGILEKLMLEQMFEIPGNPGHRSRHRHRLRWCGENPSPSFGTARKKPRPE